MACVEGEVTEHIEVGDGILVTVRRSKTNQEGEVKDVRFVKDGVARALRTLRAATGPEAGDRVVPLSAQMIRLRFTAAARAAGVESRVTAHSGHVGLASELTSRGASTTDVMLAGNWKTSRMVAHYLRWRNCGAWCCCTLPVNQPPHCGLYNASSRSTLNRRAR